MTYILYCCNNLCTASNLNCPTFLCSYFLLKILFSRLGAADRVCISGVQGQSHHSEKEDEKRILKQMGHDSLDSWLHSWLHRFVFVWIFFVFVVSFFFWIICSRWRRRYRRHFSNPTLVLKALVDIYINHAWWWPSYFQFSSLYFQTYFLFPSLFCSFADYIFLLLFFSFFLSSESCKR